jgi:hypothetical protein
MIQQSSDGSVLQWALPSNIQGCQSLLAGKPISLSVVVSPCRRDHVLKLEYIWNNGPVNAIAALPSPLGSSNSSRIFHVVLPPQEVGTVEFIPVLYHRGKPISPALLDSSACVTRLTVCDAIDISESDAELNGQASIRGRFPTWEWGFNFLATVNVRLSKEVIGDTPDGLHINWHIVEGILVGPGMEAVVCPGGADWMRIRRDGIGVVDVNASFRARSGAMIYANYSGQIDLGVDGYQRALCDDFDPSPPVIVAPTYITADSELAWLNRLQCLGVGRVDLKSLEVLFDVYSIAVGSRHPSRNPI